MKNSIFTLLLILGAITITDAQVTSLKYLLEYNESTSLYDVKIVIEEGSATTIVQRIQFNAQVSIIVPTGSTISMSEFFNPIQDNQDYMGTVPLEWILSAGVISPPGQPESDFYAIFPNLGITSLYNDIFEGDTITLFNIDVDVEPCENSVRFFENGVDPGPVEFPNNENFNNSFAIGSIQQIYNGNLDSYYATGWDITIEDYEICEGECVELIPSLNCSTDDLTYAWSTGETTPTITVCPDVSTTYTVDITAPNNDMLNLQSNVSVFSAPVVSVNGPNTICVGESTFLDPTTGGTWVSDDPTIATVTNAGVVTGISTGIAGLKFTDTTTGCMSETLEIDVIDNPVAIITGPDSVCVSGSTTLIPDSGGTWVSDNPAIATIDNSGNVTANSPGCVTFVFTNSSTGCTSGPSDPVCIFENPTVSITGGDVVCVGEPTSVASDNGTTDGVWQSNNIEVATVDPVSGEVIGISSGQTTFTYTIALGCSATTDPITFIPLPNASIEENEICIGSSTNVTPTTGGMWTVSDPNIATFSDVGVIEGIEEGMVSLIFTDSITGCSSPEIILSVESTPTVAYTGPDTICTGEMTTISPTSGGLWTLSFTNSVIGTTASIDNSGNITGLNEGQAVFTYVSGTGCGSSSSDTLTVFDLPEVAITGNDSLCVGECSLASSNSGGFWSSANISIATIEQNTGKITAVGPGYVTFDFIDSISGCYSSTTGLIVYFPPTISTNFDTICTSATALLSSSSVGTWEALHPEIAALDSNTVIGVSEGNAGFLFTSDSTGCVSDTLFIHVYPEIVTNLAGPNEICIGSTTTIEPNSGGTWSSTDPSIATISNFGNITAIQPGETSFIFTSASTLCESSPSEPVTVLPNPIDFSNPEVDACLGTTLGIFPNPTGGKWISSNPDIAIIDSISGLVTTVSAGVTNLTFTDDSTGCLSTLLLEVFAPTATSFTGDSIICIGATSTVFPNTGGTWVSGDPSVATIDISGNILGIAPGIASLIFTDSNNGCGSLPIDIVVLPDTDPMCIVGINDLESTNIQIYPNPANDLFYVESESMINSLGIYSSSFQLVKKKIYSNPQNTVQMSTDELNHGLYYIAIQTEGRIIYKKLIIE